MNLDTRTHPRPYLQAILRLWGYAQRKKLNELLNSWRKMIINQVKKISQSRLTWWQGPKLPRLVTWLKLIILTSLCIIPVELVECGYNKRRWKEEVELKTLVIWWLWWYKQLFVHPWAWSLQKIFRRHSSGQQILQMNFNLCISWI